MSEHPSDGAPDGVPQDLWLAAQRAQANAYVPYSRFPVGAAVRAPSGTIYAGANVENASFGLTRCAEQSAVQALVTAGQRAPADDASGKTDPEKRHRQQVRRRFSGGAVGQGEERAGRGRFGACGQVLFEFAPQARVYLVNTAGVLRETTVAELLPAGFRL